MSEHDTPASQTPSTPPPSDGEKREGLDWRILAIIALALVFLVAAYVNRRYTASKKGKTTETVQAQPPGGAVAEAKRTPVTIEDAYQRLFPQREIEATQTLFVAGEHVFTLAHAAVPLRDREHPDRMIGLMPGRLFDLTQLAPDVQRPERIHRRPGFGGQGMLSADHIMPLGIDEQIKLVIKPAAEVLPEQIKDDDAVIGIVVGEEARAYPIKMMNYHEVANDTLGGRPVAVTWSAFAHAASAMVRTLEGEEKPILLASSALVYQGANLFYDVRTESLWHPVRRACIAGVLVNRALESIPAVQTAWAQWKALHPATTVLVALDPDVGMDYNQNPAVPPDYAKSPQVFFPTYGLDLAKSPMYPKHPVYGVITPDGKTARAYSVAALMIHQAGENPPFSDTLGGQPVTVAWDKNSHLLTVTTSDGATLPGELMFWGVWFGAHPTTEVWDEEALRKTFQENLAKSAETVKKALEQSGAPASAAPAGQPMLSDSEGGE